MSLRELIRRSPGGHYVTVRWDGAEPVSQVAGIRFAGGSVGRGFQVQPPGAHDFAMTHLADGSTSRRLLVGRHEVKVSTAGDGSSTTATLIGAHHELMTVFMGPSPELNRIADIFAVFDIDDDADGMRVQPAPVTGLSAVNEHLVVVAADFTSIDVPGPAHADDLVPKRRGRSTRHGEVWRSLLPKRGGGRAHDYAYIVGTPTGAAEVIASDPDAVSESDLLTMVDSVDVSWRRGRGGPGESGDSGESGDRRRGAR